MNAFNFKSHGHLVTYIHFEDPLEISLENVKFVFPKEVNKLKEKKFTISGYYEGEDLDTYIQNLVDKVLSWFSLVFYVPVNSYFISSTNTKTINTNIKNVTVTPQATKFSLSMTYSIRRASIVGVINFNKGDHRAVKLQKLVNEIQELPVEINLFMQAFATKDKATKFWYYYLILVKLVVVSEREDSQEIDKFIKKTNPKIKKVKSDFRKGKEVSITTAIRDSFSHGSTFDGQKLNLDAELENHLPQLNEIIRDLLFEKYL